MCKPTGFVLIPVSMIDELRDIKIDLDEDARYGNLTLDGINAAVKVLNQVVKIGCDQIDDE